MARNTTLAVLLAIVAIHISLAALFAANTPFRTAGVLFGSRDPATGLPLKVQDIGAPDERQHVNYIARLVHGGGFPIFNPKDPNLYETYQSHQPPVFYLVGAAWSTALGISLPPAPPATEGQAISNDDGLKLRALNVVIGSLTIAGIFFLAYWAFRDEKSALVTAMFAALLPMNAAIDGAVSNDPLLILFCTWTLALVAKSLRDGWTTKVAVLIGIATGLAILTKTTGVALLPILLVSVFVRGTSKPTAAQIVSATVPILILVLPWWLRNQKLYGDPLAISAFNQAFVGSPQASSFLQALGPAGYWIDMVASWSVRSFIGVFGYMDIWITNTGGRSGANSIYQVTWLLLLAAFVGWILSVKSAPDRIGRTIHAINFGFFLIVLALFLKFNTQYFQAQARYVLPALGPIACGVGVGMSKLWRERWAMALASVLLIFGFADVFALSKLSGEFSRRVEAAKSIP